MFVTSKSHGEKIYHKQNCLYVLRIHRKNREYIHTIEEAQKKGYRACNCCSALGIQYKKEQKNIKEFCKDNKIEIKLFDNVIYINTFKEAWKIIQEKKKLSLYHMSKSPFNYCIAEDGSYNRQYHNQNVKKNSIMGYLRYINNHDKWRAQERFSYQNLPTHSKKQKSAYNNAKYKAQMNSINNVYFLLDKLQYDLKYGKK